MPSAEQGSQRASEMRETDFLAGGGELGERIRHHDWAATPRRFLPRAFMKYGWDLYAPGEKTRNSPYVSPLRASNEELQGLPSALVITAENDPLRDEGEAYARKLKEAGVSVTATRYNGMIHDFMLLNAIHDVAGVQECLEQTSNAIRDALKGSGGIRAALKQ